METDNYHLGLLLFSNTSFADPCNAGEDGEILICKNQPVNLNFGLNGQPDSGGQWFDFNNSAHDGSIDAGEANAVGNYVYYYVVSGRIVRMTRLM